MNYDRRTNSLLFNLLAISLLEYSSSFNAWSSPVSVQFVLHDSLLRFSTNFPEDLSLFNYLYINIRFLFTYSISSERLLPLVLSISDVLSSILNCSIILSNKLSFSQYCFSSFSMCSQFFLQSSDETESIASFVNL